MHRASLGSRESPLRPHGKVLVTPREWLDFGTNLIAILTLLAAAAVVLMAFFY